ncbi:unnamed protein product, partial [Ectocarpus sp. 13 AM-2016]
MKRQIRAGFSTTCLLCFRGVLALALVSLLPSRHCGGIVFQNHNRIIRKLGFVSLLPPPLCGSLHPFLGCDALFPSLICRPMYMALPRKRVRPPHRFRRSFA